MRAWQGESRRCADCGHGPLPDHGKLKRSFEVTQWVRNTASCRVCVACTPVRAGDRRTVCLDRLNS